MTKAELIAALEKATGPCRELDAAIFYDLLGHCRHANKVRSGAQSDTGFDCPDCGADSWGNTGPTGQRLHHTVPAYSASIDAALTLVPANALWGVKALWDQGPDANGGPKAYRGSVDVYEVRDGLFWKDNYLSLAPTPVLAIVIAALRAQQEGEGA